MPTLLFVRGLGANREWMERLGDLSVDGVGFDFPTAPAARDFEVSFRLPGEGAPRSLLATVTEARPRGRMYFVGARIEGVDDDARRAIARALDARRIQGPARD
ncbi:MAG: PilZ domain-containing protein [Deltaproteobacteria bacterium]|nr:PilZ domain-containing protein [Deltaproteobacteria bacterium]